MMRMRKGNGFWRFCFSLLPGAGEMYMGFMKQGAMLMTLFFGCGALSGWLNLDIFGYVLPVIWFYGFSMYTIWQDFRMRNSTVWRTPSI